MTALIRAFVGHTSVIIQFIGMPRIARIARELAR